MISQKRNSGEPQPCAPAVKVMTAPTTCGEAGVTSRVTDVHGADGSGGGELAGGVAGGELGVELVGVSGADEGVAVLECSEGTGLVCSAVGALPHPTKNKSAMAIAAVRLTARPRLSSLGLLELS